MFGTILHAAVQTLYARIAGEAHPGETLRAMIRTGEVAQAVEAAMVEMLAASGQWIRAALTSGEIAQLTQLLDRLVAAPERGEPPA